MLTHLVRKGAVKLERISKVNKRLGNIDYFYAKSYFA